MMIYSFRVASHRWSANHLHRALVAAIGVSLCFAAAGAPAGSGRSAAYCKRAGEWAAREFYLRVRNRDRTAQDAINEFKPDQLSSKAFFAGYATNVIYTEGLEVYDRANKSGNAKGAKTFLDFKRDGLREVAEELCLEPDAD